MTLIFSDGHNSDYCLTGHRFRDVHMRGIQRHGGIELERDANCQRYLNQNSPHCLFVTLHTLSLTHNTSVLKKLHTLLVFLIRAPSVALMRQKPQQLPPNCWSESVLWCGCYFYDRGRSVFRIQSFWVHPASRTSTEAHSDRGDQKHSHPHLAVKSTWRGSRCHLIHYWGLQVSNTILTFLHNGILDKRALRFECLSQRNVCLTHTT